MSLPQVAVIGPDDARTRAVTERYEQLARSYGGAVEVRWIDSGLTEEDLLQRASEAIAVIPAGPRAVTTELALRLPNLRLIQTTSAGPRRRR